MYEQDDRGFVQVYTDGSCLNNGSSNAKAGIGVSFGDRHPLNVSAPLEGSRQTSNRAEIQAANKAIQIARNSGIKKLTINTDSKYLIKAKNQWMPKWKENGWKNANGEPVKNKPDFLDLDKSLSKNKGMNVKWSYVPAHKGHKGNEQADRLARKGAAYES